MKIKALLEPPLLRVQEGVPESPLFFSWGKLYTTRTGEKIVKKFLLLSLLIAQAVLMWGQSGRNSSALGDDNPDWSKIMFELSPPAVSAALERDPVTKNEETAPPSVPQVPERDFITRNEGANIVIVRYRGTAKELNINSTINGRTVVGIDYAAFADMQINRINIPSTVEFIGESAFANNQLTSLVIPLSVKRIGDSAFSGNQLQRITIPESMSIIADGVFSDNRLTEVNLPRTVTTIGAGAFANNLLKLVHIPSGVSSVGERAFHNNQLTAATFESGITSIGAGAFLNNAIATVDIPDTLGLAALDAFDRGTAVNFLSK